MDPDKRHKKLLIQKEKDMFANINSENLLKNIFQVSLNSIIIALINLTFHIILSRKLGPAPYGELETLLTINNVILISLSAVCFIVTKFVSYYRTRQQYDKMKFLANWAFIFFFMIGMATFFINLMMSNIIAGFLNIEDSMIIVIFGFLIWISFMMPIIEGILRGLQEFNFVGRYKLLDAITRLAIATVLIYLGMQIKTIVAGLAVGAAITLLFSGYILKKVYINKPYKINLKEIYRFAMPVFLACVFYATLSNIDLILVKHFFDPKTTGYFAAAAMLAKLVLAIAFGSAGVMFPKLIEQYSNGDSKGITKTFRNTLKIALIGGLILTLVIALYPHAVSKAIFGAQYSIDEMLSVYAFATLFLSISVILMMYDLAVKKYKFIIVFCIAAFIMIYQIITSHETLYSVVWALFTIDLLVMIFMLIYNKKAVFSRYY